MSKRVNNTKGSPRVRCRAKRKYVGFGGKTPMDIQSILKRRRKLCNPGAR